MLVIMLKVTEIAHNEGGQRFPSVAPKLSQYVYCNKKRIYLNESRELNPLIWLKEIDDLHTHRSQRNVPTQRIPKPFGKF